MELCMSTNGYKVITSGSVLLLEKNAELEMHITADNGFNFDIVLKFIEDEDKKDRDVIKEVDGKKIIYKCINFSTSGVGTTKPLSIATVDKKEWFLHFWANQPIENGPRRVEYSILEKE